MSLSAELRQRLLIEASEFASSELYWDEPLNSETEPQYTARVLMPSFMEFVDQLGHDGLVLRSDGGMRPLSVTLSGRNFYPDLAVNHHRDRELAIEIKFATPTDIGTVLTTAIGQAVCYTLGGYSLALVLAVSKTGAQLLNDSMIGALNDKLMPLNIAFVELHL